MILFASGEEIKINFDLKPGELEIKPSFENASYYFYPTKGEGEKFAVEFRRKGETAWQSAMSPVINLPAGVWKGSLFGLREDISYELQVRPEGGDKILFQGGFKTWKSSVPVARVIDLSERAGKRKGIVISEEGSPNGWIKLVASRPIEIIPDDPNDPESQATIAFKNARYVIMENVKIVSGHRCAVDVTDSDDIRILNCDLSGWGLVGTQNFDDAHSIGQYFDEKGKCINYDAGVRIYHSARTVVERCYIHDPKSRANSWMFSHPAGPSAVYVYESRGGTVLRWNDFIGSDEHRWNDVVESSENSSPSGGFFRDADIYGNFHAFGNDDGIELEGGGMNVRFYQNKVEGTLCGVSTGACLLGPQYIFNNLLVNPGDESGLSLQSFKNGHSALQTGKRFVLNNTVFCTNNTAYGNIDKLTGTWLGFARNNIFVCAEERMKTDRSTKFDNFNNNLFWDGKSAESSQKAVSDLKDLGLEKTGICADPELINPLEGNFQLRSGSPAKGKSVGLSNLTREGSDLGAFIGAVDDLPNRPLALFTEPRQLQFNSPLEKSTLEMLLVCPENAAHAIQFQIRQNQAFTWFKVEPASGEIKPGKTLKLTVSLPQKLTGRPWFRGAFLVRTPEGLSRPVTIYAKGQFTERLHRPEAPNSVYLDPTAGTNAFIKKDDSENITGGKYALLDGVAQQPVLDFKFTPPGEGKYYLLARLRRDEPNAVNRIFECALDGASPFKITVEPSYQWHRNNNAFRVVWMGALGNLRAEEHRFILKPVKGGSCLNDLIVTDKPSVFFIQHDQADRKLDSRNHRDFSPR